MEGLTIEEAIKLLDEKFEEEKAREIQIVANGENFTLIPEQLEVKYHVDEAIDEAYNIGRNGNIIENNFEILKTMFEETLEKLKIKYRLLVSLMPFVVMTLFREKKFSKSPQAF